MGKFDNFCQSCGIPLEKVVDNMGTNKDGTVSKEYCGLCYENGEFIDDFTTAKEMIDFIKQEFKKEGYNWFLRWFYTSHISQLNRWNK